MSRPSFLFDVSAYRQGGGRIRYDVTPDGQRFLFIEDIEPEPMPDHLTLIVNWFDELENHFADE